MGQKQRMKELNEEYLINYCKRDNVWLVQRRTARKRYMYITIAECFTSESAEILRNALINALIKKEDEDGHK